MFITTDGDMQAPDTSGDYRIQTSVTGEKRIPLQYTKFKRMN